MTIDNLKKQLQSGEMSPLYYMAGDEQYLLDHYFNRFKEVCVPALPEFNLIEIDGKKMDFDYLADACSAYPAMSDKKLVIVTDLEPSTVKGNNEKKLSAAIGDIAPGVTVLFWEHAKEKTKSNSVESAVKKAGGELVRADRPKPEVLAAWVRKMVAAENGTISDRDCSYLVEITGNSMLRLHSEVNKLLSFVKGGEIDRALIDKMVAPSEDTSWFGISNAIAEHDFDALMQALQALYRQNVDESVIAGMFYRTYMDLWRGEIALNEGHSSAELASVCGISPYAAARIMRSAERMQEGEALDGLRRCLELDRKLKTSGLNKKDLIYTFAAELLAFQMKDHE